MKKIGNTQESKPQKQEQSVEILLPEGLAAYLTPISIFFSAIILAVAVISAGNKIAGTVGTADVLGKKEETGTTTTTTTEAQPEKPKVELKQIQALFDDKTTIHFGDKKEKVLFVEVSDPSCPFCQIASGMNSELNSQYDRFKLVADGGTYLAPVPEMEKLVKEGKAGFVYIYNNGHGNGELAAQALYCAYNDSKDDFWKVHDKLMSNKGYEMLNGQGTNTAENIANLLSDEFDKGKMLECLNSKKYAEMLTRDESTAKSLGVSGTPGFFVNDTNFAGAYSYNDMKSIVEAALK